MTKFHGHRSKGGRVPVTLTPVIYGPRQVPDDCSGVQLDDYHRVVAKIDKMKAGVAKVYLESGYCCCVGLLDPITNIIINGSIFSYAESSDMDGQAVTGWPPQLSSLPLPLPSLRGGPGVP